MRMPPTTNMQFYARQAGFLPFVQLGPRHQADVEAAALPGVWVHAAKLWWKRQWSEHGWVWEPLKVE